MIAEIEELPTDPRVENETHNSKTPFQNEKIFRSTFNLAN